MGIPSYFSYIVKNYSNIIKKISYFYDVNNSIQHLYLDSNSIVYDAVSNIKYEDITDDEYEDRIIEFIIDKILYYMNKINPLKTMYITFDGVAPFAKMNQQRTRRYKNLFINKLNNIEKKWNTANITPGTLFMKKLTSRINKQVDKWNNEKTIKIIFSGSDKQGEGEHKLFQMIRDTQLTSDKFAIYGLDSDLLMLSIFHLQYCNNIYVFRETPEFVKNNNIKKLITEHEEFCFMDIKEFVNTIQENMECVYNNIRRTYDYMFICFLLGNDFLPHFPALNIRTHGIQVLLDIYRLHIGNNEDRYLITKDYKIIWKNVKILINEIAKIEHELILKEYNYRNKIDINKIDSLDKFHNIPIIHRYIEKYICPTEDKWMNRYYQSIFNIVYENNQVKDICNNYLEGLEWVFKYYTVGCIDWRWSYKYEYPPLFSDLCKYVSDFDMKYFTNTVNTSYNNYTQLAYVLPKENLSLLPKNIQHILLTNYSYLYPEKYNFMFAYCRYFWESHPVIPRISNEIMNKWNNIFV